MSNERKVRNPSGAGGGAMVVFLVAALAAKVAWGRIVPAVAGGAVVQGMVSESLPWTGALTLGAVAATAHFLARHPRTHRHRKIPGTQGELNG